MICLMVLCAMCLFYCQESFQGVKSWIRELREKGPRNIIIAIAGNKIDLEDQREVATAGRFYCIVTCCCLKALVESIITWILH